MTQYKSIAPILSQMFLQKCGCFCSERLSVDLYYLMEAVNLLIPDFGERELEKIYNERGKDWFKTKEKLELLSKIINKTKIFYDPIIDKKFEKRDIDSTKTQNMFKKHFIKNAGKINLLQNELYELFVILVRNTNLQSMTISSDAFKILEHQGFRKIDLTKKQIPLNQMEGENKL